MWEIHDWVQSFYSHSLPPFDTICLCVGLKGSFNISFNWHILNKWRKPISHHAVDLEEKPLLYEYYANTLNPIIDRRNFEEPDIHLGKRSIDFDSDRYAKRFFLERSKALPSVQEQQQKQVSKTIFLFHFNLFTLLLWI